MEEAALDPSSDRFWKSRAPVFFQNDRVSIDAKELLALSETAGLVLFETSGSHGEPKTVGLTREALLASAAAVNAFLGVTRRDRWLRVLPLFHVGGFGLHARAWLSETPLIVDDSRWDVRRFAYQCREQRITLTSLVPAQVYDLVASKFGAPGSLRAVIVGGSDLRPALWERARELGWPLLTSYGLTEAASQVATLQPGDQDPTELSVLDHWETRLSAKGALSLKGPALFSGYFVRQPSGAWVADQPGGWFETSDRVNLTIRCGRRVLRFLGRRDRIIKVLGELVDLDQLDRQLAEVTAQLGIPGRARLFSVPDDRRGSTLVLEHETGVAGAALLCALNEKLPRFAQVQHTRETPEIHRSPLGKPMA